jgi:hypothetical protein
MFITFKSELSKFVHQKYTKLSILIPMVLIDFGSTVLKHKLFLSNQIVHKTTTLIISTNCACLTSIEASKNQISSKVTPWKAKLLWQASHCQMQLTKEQVTNKWS